jgi:hypothetical protein
MYAAPLGPKNRRRMIYRCPTSHLGRHLDPVDDVVTAAVLARLSRPDAADLFVQDVDVDALRRELADLSERREALVTMIADGLLPAAAGRERAADLTRRMHDVERAVTGALRASPGLDLATTTDVYEAWSRLSLLQRREVIDLLCRVTILPQGRGVDFDPSKVQIEWRQG